MVEKWPFPLGWLPGRWELQDSGGYTWKFKQHDEHSAFLSSLFSQPLWDAPRWWIKIRDRPPVCSWCFFPRRKTSEPPVRSRQVQNAWTKIDALVVTWFLHILNIQSIWSWSFRLLCEEFLKNNGHLLTFLVGSATPIWPSYGNWPSPRNINIWHNFLGATI